jgi:glycosyltransferase involved in cell wall biosynthesis
MAPKVSICIPTYNREELLKETIESIFMQTYKDYEVVIVDDGSTDDTEQMIKDTGYPVRYYWQENSGDAAARNKLIKLADGRYISFLDSDDLLPPDALERMVDVMSQEPEDVIVYGPYVAIDRDGNVCKRKRKKLYSGYITQDLFENILVHSCGSMFPKKVLEEAGGFNEALPLCADYDLWLRLSQKYRFIAINEPLFKRRRHSGNLSQYSFTNRKTEFDVLENFYYNGGGEKSISQRRAMKRLSKEGYRAGKCAIRESLPEPACQLLRQSFRRHPNLKSLLWWTIATAKLHPALRDSTLKKKSAAKFGVAFDFDPALKNKFSGFYTVGTGLLKGFDELEEKPEFLLFHSRYSVKEAKLIKKGLGLWTKSITTSIKMRWLESFWRHSNYPKLEYFAGDFDIYHSLHHLMPPTKGKPRILTVHDLRRYKLPKLYTKSKLAPFEFAVKNADHFIAVSESTKKDLCDIFGIPSEKVDVVHLAANSSFKPVPKSKKLKIKQQLSEMLEIKLENFLMAVSSPDRRKNMSRIIQAFLSVYTQMPENLKLVIVGSLPKNDETFNLTDFDKISGSVIVTGPLENINDLFACADALVFASLYEGFGIPIVEAFACGVPVITSNCSSMPEVAGDAALYVNPYSVESIAGAMVRICSEAGLPEKLVELGFARLKNFSWKKTAAETLKVYRKLL